MKHGIKFTFVGALLALCVAVSSAEEKFGVKVYEGAQLSKETSEQVSEAFSVEAFCYRTKDSLDKVVEFYKKEPGLEFMGAGGETARQGAMFKKGDVNITIQNPWMDMKSGQLTKDTLITIAKEK
jgi:hypothetical protein